MDGVFVLIDGKREEITRSVKCFENQGGQTRWRWTSRLTLLRSYVLTKPAPHSTSVSGSVKWQKTVHSVAVARAGAPPVAAWVLELAAPPPPVCLFLCFGFATYSSEASSSSVGEARVLDCWTFLVMVVV